MLTFLFQAARRDGVVRAAVDEVLEGVRDVVPPVTPCGPLRCVDLPEVHGAWCWTLPADMPAPALLSEAVSQDLAVLAFGEVFETARRPAADAVAQAFRTGGVTAARRLCGCYSAVVVDRTAEDVFLLGDALGRRALRYFADADGLWVSPHDLTLLATGRCSPDFDLVSAYSALLLDWSIRGRSMIKSIGTLRPTGYVHWRRGTLSTHEEPILRRDERINPGDRAAIARQRERIIDVLHANLRTACEDAPLVRTDLTAGIDSRVIFALAMSVLGRDRIEAVCCGEADAPEVAFARRLATRYGVSFCHRVPDLSALDHFVPFADAMAFYMNGDTSAKRAANPPPAWPPSVVHLCGGGGEMCRGYVRPPASDPNPDLRATDVLVQTILAEFGVPWLPRAQPELHGSLSARLRDYLVRLTEIAVSGRDLLDLFYTFDRFGIWNAMDARFPWMQHRWLPFGDPRVVQLALQLPAPIGDYSHVHRAVIRRLLPAAYWMRINNNALLPLMGHGRIRRWARQADARFRALRRRLRREWLDADGNTVTRHGPVVRPGGHTLDHVYAEAFAGPLASVMRDTLLVSGSLATDLLGRAVTERMLAEQETRRGDHRKVIGNLFTIERFRVMALRVCARARGAPLRASA